MNVRPISAMEKSNNHHLNFFDTGYKQSNSKMNQISGGFGINDCNDKKARPGSTVFYGDKTKSSRFFKSTKVDSCSHVVEHKGQTFAVPYNVKNSKGRPLSSFKYHNLSKKQPVSVYRQDYCIKPIMHAGMTKKPLVVYDPNSYRNRLPTGDFFMPHKNISNLDIGEKTDINNKQWLSTTKDSFQWPKPVPISNSGILASTFKNHHKKLVSYQ